MIDKLLNPSQKKILVIGDVILDHYVYGKSERISPEAPVQIISKQNDEYKLGGAANVYQNLTTLGAKCEIISVIGSDNTGDKIVNNIHGEMFFRFDNAKITPVKTRIIASDQQILRIDHETTTPISNEISQELLNHIKSELNNACLIILSDYGKGVLTNTNLVKNIIYEANSLSIPVLIDPHNGSGNFQHFKNATMIKVNKKQVKTLGCNFDCDTQESINDALMKLLNMYNLEMAMITLADKGLAVKYKSDFYTTHYKSEVQEIYDVTGAGDSTIAAFAFALSVGINHHNAAKIANIAGNISVQHHGTYAVTINDLIKFLNKKENKKIINNFQNIKKEGSKIVFVNGCFDILHPGHIAMLKFAKTKGDILVVGLNSDNSVKSLKGDARPIIRQDDRAAVLSALECVDYVYIFNETTPHKTIELLKPDIHVKGSDHINQTEGVPLTIFFDRVGNYSTTNYLDKKSKC